MDDAQTAARQKMAARDRAAEVNADARPVSIDGGVVSRLGVAAGVRTRNAESRFSGGPDEQATPEQVTKLLAIADRLLCKA